MLATNTQAYYSKCTFETQVVVSSIVEFYFVNTYGGQIILDDTTINNSNSNNSNQGQSCNPEAFYVRNGRVSTVNRVLDGSTYPG
jgi:hypothetical protein